MVEIFSKRDGPRREDVQVRRLIEQNRGVIGKLADQLSNGGFTRARQPRPVPQAEGPMIHIGGAPAKAAPPEPRLRATPNHRIIAVDERTGRQLVHFGDIRETPFGQRLFSLAIAANGYVAPLEETVAVALADIDGVAIGPSYSAADLVADIGRRLQIAVAE